MSAATAKRSARGAAVGRFVSLGVRPRSCHAPGDNVQFLSPVDPPSNAYVASACIYTCASGRCMCCTPGSRWRVDDGAQKRDGALRPQ